MQASSSLRFGLSYRNRPMVGGLRGRRGPKKVMIESLHLIRFHAKNKEVGYKQSRASPRYVRLELSTTTTTPRKNNIQNASYVGSAPEHSSKSE